MLTLFRRGRTAHSSAGNSSQTRRWLKPVLRTILLPLLALSSLPSWAFTMEVANVDEVPLTMTLRSYNNCYRATGSWGANQSVTTIQPGQNFSWTFRHESSGGCGSVAGEFYLQFDPAPTEDGIERNAVAFWHDGGEALGLLTSKIPDPYEGELEGSNGFYRYYTSGRTLKYTAALSPGKWEKVCTDKCGYEQTSNYAYGMNYSVTGMEREELSATLFALRKGVTRPTNGDNPPTVDRYLGKRMADNFEQNRLTLNMEKVEKSPELMARHKIKAVWHWVVPVRLSTGRMFNVNSGEYACTSNENPPFLSPVSSTAVASCLGALALDKPLVVSEP